jgi:hypothetical protein
MIEAISAEEKRHKMLLPLVGVPCLIQEGLEPYRDLFCRKAGFEWVSRYVTGLLLSPHKTLQGSYAQHVWFEDQAPSRRALHAAVLEAGWDSEGLLPRHRAVGAGAPRGRGRSVSTEEASAAAEREVREIDGVMAVENELQVVPDVAAKRVEREDEKLQAAVEKRIEDRESLADDEIAVAVSDGVVRLTGNVGSHGEKIAALTIARTTDGVRSTVDGLSVRPNDAR